MAYCELTGAVKGYDGETLRPGANLTIHKVLSVAGTIMWTQKETHTLKIDGTWHTPLRIERGAVAYISMNAPGFDRDKQNGMPVQIPDAATALLASIPAAVSLPQQAPVAIPPSIEGAFLKLEGG